MSYSSRLFRYFDELQHSNASHYVSLREALKGNPIVIANSAEFAYNLLQQGNYIYPVIYFFILFY
jgi:hypothetical protein